MPKGKPLYANKVLTPQNRNELLMTAETLVDMATVNWWNKEPFNLIFTFSVCVLPPLGFQKLEQMRRSG